MKQLTNLVVFLQLLVPAWMLAQSVAPTQPSLMIVPSDGMLERYGHMDYVEINGRKHLVQDYQQLFVDEPELRFAISQIQERFAAQNFPTMDMEFALKGIDADAAFDAAENINLSVKDILLRETRPDIYLDLEYFYTGSGLQKTLAFNLRAIDAYSDRAVATVSNSGIRSVNGNVVELLARQVEDNMNNFESSLNQHFADIRANGRVVAVRVNVEKNGPIRDFRRERCASLPYNRLIQTYIREHAVAGAHHLKSAGPQEIKYDVVRIPLYDKEGYPMAATDWAFQFSEWLSEQCGHTVIDITSSIGEVHLLFIAE